MVQLVLLPPQLLLLLLQDRLEKLIEVIKMDLKLPVIIQLIQIDNYTEHHKEILTKIIKLYLDWIIHLRGRCNIKTYKIVVSVL